MRIGIDGSRAFGIEKTGTENYSFQMIRHLLMLPEAKKHEWVIYVKDDGLNVRTDYACGDNVTVVPVSLKRLWTQAGLALRTWTDGLDVLWVPAHTLPVIRHPRMRTVVTIHGIEYEWLPAFENRLQRWYLPLSTQYAVATADQVIAVSEFTKRQLIERLGTKTKKVFVIPEGFEPFTDTTAGREKEVLKKYDIQAQKYILFVGTIQPRKNLVKLIEAFSLICDKPTVKEVKLVIAGKWGWLFDEVRQAPKFYGVEDRVVFTGYINNTERNILLRNAIVYCQPSITEGFGLPVLEAMAAGVPVVSSCGGALPEVLHLGSGVWGKSDCAGLLFDPTNTEEMSKSFMKMLVDKKLRQEMVRRGKMRAKDFSWENAARETLAVLVGK